MEKKRAVIFLVLVLGCVAADIVAPTKSELAALYRKATTQAAAHQYAAALDSLALLDARQPDLAVVENLRGVIFLRQGEEARATKALERALEIDPQFWAARFNLADIPFQKKEWGEAGKRLERLLEDLPQPARDEMGPLIHYKILLTVLLAKREGEVGSLLSELKESKQSPAFDFGEAAIAFQHGRMGTAKGWVAAAAKDFPAAANKPFLEPFYQLGWLPRPVGEPIATADFAAPEGRLVQRPSAQGAFEKAQRALQERDFDRASAALKEVPQTAVPEPAYSELSAEIFIGKKQFGEAEAALAKAQAAAAQSWKTNFLRARLAFAREDYAAAQQRFEELLHLAVKNSQPEKAALARYQLFLSQLLAGKESMAQQTLDQFKFTDPTPAFYFAQAVWSLAHHKEQQARTWIESADKLFSRDATSAFVSPLADLGWLGISVDGSAIVAAAPSATGTAEPLPNAAPGPSPTPRSAAVAEKMPAPTPVASPEKTVASSDKSSPSVSPETGRGKEQSAPRRSAKAPPPKKRRTDDSPEMNRTKPVASATPVPTPTPRPPFLDRLARTLLKPFKPTNRKQNQTPSREQQSPSPTASKATPARPPLSN